MMKFKEITSNILKTNDIAIKLAFILLFAGLIFTGVLVINDIIKELI